MISFVCGHLCSGKTLYSQSLAKMCEGVHIEVGDVVRYIKNTQDRKLLQDSSDLAEQIISYLKTQIKLMSGKDLVVSGVRQQKILEAFPESIFLWIECPKNERKKRYVKRSREGDTQTFEEAEAGDVKLGIIEVKRYIFKR